MWTFPLSPLVPALFGVEASPAVASLSTMSYRHILRQRALHPADALVAISWVEHVAIAPHLGGLDPRDPRRALVVATIPGDGRDLALAVKLVPAAASGSGRDEFWITTALCLGRLRVARYRRLGRLAPLRSE